MFRLSRCLALIALVASSAVNAATHFAVTSVFLATGDSSDAAIEACDQTYQAAAVGVDWGMVNGSTVAHLCQQRQRLEDVKPTQRVLQKIGVYGATECPPKMELFYRPKYFRVVCLKWESASIALSSGNYISDIWVSTQRNYNNDDIGWTSLHANAFTPAASLGERFHQKLWTPAYHGTFISYKRPVLPIREVRVLQQNDTSEWMSACSTALGGEWEDTSESYPIHTVDSRRTLCVRRSNKTSEPALLATRVTTHADSCANVYNQTEAFGNGVYICLMYANQDEDTAMTPIVTMHVEPWNEHSEPDLHLPGGLERVTAMSLNYPLPNGEAAYLYKAIAATTKVWVPEALDRPPIVAKPVSVAGGKAGNLTFKILQLSDLHYTGDPTTKCHDTPLEMKAPSCNEALMTKYVNELLDLEKPDYVVFAGDNVQTYKTSLRQASMDAATAGVEARGIPYAMIYGNHDDQRGFTREMMVEMAMAKPHSYTQRGPEEVYGIGNYELNIKAPVDGPWGSAGSDVFRMYFLDSNAYPDHGALSDEDTKYDWIRPSQVAYYRQMSASHTDNQVPAIMFFHIPLPEYAMDVAAQRTGRHREYVQSSEVHSDMFATLVELEEVKATFAGHDHANEYCYKRESIQLCYGGGAGLGMAYGWKEVQRRARVIEWSVDSANNREIRSWKRVFEQLEERLDEQVLYTESE
ncbi:hypothetical protein Poli38472_011783 [Pythium oligandrum]|uniref:Calcineurin-like phosphoesterase domain-containing protein n=1 Tax=Pythium oligandrum TaxID=41045 RepID=A0A8K1C832_PYTOL|nr:hypothetical protein Poli38472_011783 [Pythium oligandrum]|eukprot:TMW58195.1 hypothetical protein Poli38472_011783 [Pythium oligandrum]